MTVKPDKRLTKLLLRFGSIDWERATAKQYELLKDERVWRAFINGYAKNGFVIFDEEALPREELLKRLGDLEPEIVREESVTVGELIESSYSWNNILGKMES
ncbi:DUF3213 domain-containing protein [Thermococcus barossii]|uniref:DUF3213 domain-containing protein n=1 Tax=Thermococcus barossii TaxID=54077 RepID=A0A2Z2MI58_9EURY|nr:DUF3213 domain-containing protein [Thermococcus barossii]ASJ05393.1 hypothetical protein A3L01_08470 [Thermococcus barossii]